MKSQYELSRMYNREKDARLKRKREKLVELCERHNIRVLSDRNDNTSGLDMSQMQLPA